MKKPQVKNLRTLLTILLMLIANLDEIAFGKTIDHGIMIVAYDGNAWYPYIRQMRGKWLKIKDIVNPANITWQSKSNHLVFKADDRMLYEYDLKTQAIIPIQNKKLKSGENNVYTQFRASPEGILMVKLKEGKSQDTDIVVMQKKQQISALFKQESAQFHPYSHDNYLYYAHVSCRRICSPLIQEVWRTSWSTKQTEQLTLLNAVSYLHSVDASGKFGFLSSNKHGYYHIAKINLQNNAIYWLTKGSVTDNFPSIAPSGDLYFIRITSAGTQLLKLQKSNVEKPNSLQESAYQQISLPKHVQKIRYLEIN